MTRPLLSVGLALVLAFGAPPTAGWSQDPTPSETAESVAQEGSEVQPEPEQAPDTRKGKSDREGYKPGWGQIIVGGILIGLGLTVFKPSKADERAVDYEVIPEIERKYRVLSSGAHAERLARVTERLVPAIPANQMRHPVLIQALDSDEINAFTLPGGHIYFFRGLMDIMPDDAQLAGVLGHEIGHVNKAHFRSMFKQSVLIQGLFYVGIGATGRNAGRWKKEAVAAAGNVAGILAMLKFSRNHEYEADQKGVEYSRLAGYPEDSMARALQALDGAKSGKGPPGWLATHPPAPDRIARVTPKPQGPKEAPARPVEKLDHSGHVVVGAHQKGKAAVVVHGKMGTESVEPADLVYHGPEGTREVSSGELESAGLDLTPEGLVDSQRNQFYGFSQQGQDARQRGFEALREFLRPTQPPKAAPKAIEFQPEPVIEAVRAQAGF